MQDLTPKVSRRFRVVMPFFVRPGGPRWSPLGRYHKSDHNSCRQELGPIDARGSILVGNGGIRNETTRSASEGSDARAVVIESSPASRRSRSRTGESVCLAGLG